MSWKDSAGRVEGSHGYQLGDLTRTCSKNMHDWASAPKTRPTYEFGDIFLKKVVHTVTSQFAGDGGGPEAGTSEFAEVAARLQEQRQRARDQLATGIPLLEKRKGELTQRSSDLDQVEVSELARLGGEILEKYRRALNDLEASYSSAPQITENWVACAAGQGLVPQIEKALLACATSADDCTSCVREVRAEAEVAQQAAAPCAPSLPLLPPASTEAAPAGASTEAAPIGAVEGRDSVQVASAP
eukprot:CAMPEP_0183429618 /NCGR_PEP_ID=MMETSP0370-20130417/48998_1 /TAXON_ID=268820 /ORGANISM="Peridinium aciculiferum, Strain PAER-2" /LENGTH=242 /DNA_ID=CAMNT_0025614717 /DNA_START=61 /DNA_END=789 /DNA_ORIENTATION=+